MYESFVDTARRAARAGADQLRGRWGQRLEIESKKAYDFVTDADLASERAVLSLIAERHPEHAILSEESSPDQGQELAAQGPLWVVDPLDGTTNYIHGFPHVAVSIALLLEGRPVVGVIRDVMRGEEFWAARGQGAWLDGEPIKVRQADSPGRSLLMTGFPFREKDILDTYLELFKELFSATAGVRRAGSAALDLAYVARWAGTGILGIGTGALGRGRGHRAGNRGRRPGQRLQRRGQGAVARRYRGRRAIHPCMGAGGMPAAFSAPVLGRVAATRSGTMCGQLFESPFSKARPAGNRRR